MPIDAPNPAPAETPRVYGVASGFRRMACVVEPDMANIAPARIAISIRGNRKTHTTVSANELTVR